MRLALDTNRYTDFRRGQADVVAVLEQASEILIPFAAAAELRVGFMGGNRRSENEKAFAAFLRQPGVSILYPTEQTLSTYAHVYHQLREQGTPIPTNDMWIAAAAIEHALPLYSRDSHFDHLPQIKRI